MKIDERYEIRTVVVELHEYWGTGVIPGDVYDNFSTFKKEHPFSSYKFGYVVFDTETGLVPDTCNVWYESPGEALVDYQRNCRIAEGEKTTIEITMEKTQRVAMTFDATEEQLELLKTGENPFWDVMKKEIDAGAGDTEYDYAVCDECGKMLLDWS